MKHRKRMSLYLAIIFTCIGIFSAWGIVEIAYSSIERVAPTEVGEPILFGPKMPTDFDWDHYNRFKYNSDSPFKNC